LFRVAKPIVLERERQPFENTRRIDEVETVLLEIRSSLSLIPSEAHGRTVYTSCQYVN
jgi:hypothetical protein